MQTPERETLARFTRQTRAVPARQDIAGEQARETMIRVLMDGMACRYKMMPCGRRAVTGYVLPGEFLDLGVIATGKSSASVASLTPCQIAEIPLAALTEVMGRPGVMRALLSAAIAESMILREWLAHMGQELSEKRVARLLCELRLRLERVGLFRNGDLELPLTQEELGEALGISTVHVNRVLQRLKIEGLIRLHGRTVTIPDVARLEAFADFEPDYLRDPAADILAQ
ncbi:MAG TPA: Crp/Fnr family transcriptional regulator [Bryobacteraceae bacterium]|nr:Crp/Fnr family transcriptional regulator [Bryobacteraceae bacterium]